MKLYSLKSETLSSINTDSFKLEKDIQNIVQRNLSVLFGLDFVKSEMTVKSFRIDTLAFNSENKSFVVIEYKKERNFSVIDQGYTYMSLMLNNKAEFILEYNENCKGNLKKGDVDWSQSRVIFISPNYTEYQKNSVNFKDVPFELWEIKRYENNLIGFTQYKSYSDESISEIEGMGGVVQEVAKEVKIYNEKYHLERASVSTQELYFAVKERVLALNSEIEVNSKAIYIGFKKGRNFLYIHVQKNGLWCWLNLKKGHLDDPKKLCRDVSKIGHYGNGDYELRISTNTDLDYVMFLVKQAFNNNKK